MSIRVWDVPYAYGPTYAYGAEQQHYFAELAQFLTHTNRNLGLVAADENDQPSRVRSDHARGRKHAV